jgi:hypothetical protein
MYLNIFVLTTRVSAQYLKKKRDDMSMKKTNYIRHLTLYNFILITFLFTLLYPFPSEAATAFTFNVTNPTNNEYLKENNVQFSGTYTLDPSTTLSVTITDKSDPANPVNISSDGMILYPDTWSFSKQFADGQHTVNFTATDGTNSTSIDVSFTVDTKRPIVTSYKLTSVNHVGNSNPWEESIIEDMGHVPLDVQIKIAVKDDNSVTFKKENDGTTYTNPIEVISDNQTNIVSTEDHKAPPSPEANGDYIITFTPSTQLEPSTTYYVNLTTNIIDSSGNPVYPKVIKFTTTSQKDQSNDDDPHGDYSISDPDASLNRTNLCANCHNTHTGGKVKLLGGKFIKDPTKSPTGVDNTTNYCMACHDGTSATRLASKVENMDLSTGSKHDEVLDAKHLPNEGSCASCHNPHLVWSKDNPNILKDHFVYDHKLVAPEKNAPQEILDSDEILCESCHERNTFTFKGEPGVENKISHYRKSTSRLGTKALNNNILEDNDLCFRCHNATKLPNSDIQSKYEDTSSKHNFGALDGSGVTGPLPCAECHETHGSSNIKLLKTKLGQENQQSDFTSTSGNWSADKERDFCLKCHNGSTAVYGVTGSLPNPATTGHETTSSEACSKCHASSYDPNDLMKGFVEAAHAPKAGTP